MPSINTSATGVELTRERIALITQKLAPIARLLVHEEDVAINLNVRRIESLIAGDTYCLSVKIATDRGNYIAVSSSRYLTRALGEVRESLRRSISRGESVTSERWYRNGRVEANVPYALAL